MSLCWPALILLFLFSIHTRATNSTLTAELKTFVPACAQECFESFLESNFPSSVCSSPTLDCLCSNNSTSGYTAGEGAVQCIISEDSIGGCTGVDAEETVVVDAYEMCKGQAHALPNTHSTITATLIVQSSAPSIVLVAPSPTTTTTTFISVTSSFAGSTISKTTTFSTSSIQVTTGPPTVPSTTSATIASSTAQTASQTGSAAPILTKSQIAGVTVASVGGAALAIGILIVLACWRKRKRARESNLLPFQMDPSYGHGLKGPADVAKKQNGSTGTPNGTAARVAPPVPPRLDTGLSNIFARRSIRPDVIGLAISPEHNEAAHKRPSSRLLPEKPILTLQVPKGKASSLNVPESTQKDLEGVRQSTATQFEEDDFDSADTAVAGQEDWGRASTDQILNNRTGNWTSIRHVPASSGDPPQFVVSASDWKPPNPSSTKSIPAPASSAEVEPLKLNRSFGSFSRPLVVVNDLFPRPPPAAQLTVPAQDMRLMTQSSSVYSAHNSLHTSDIGQKSASRRKSYRQNGPYDRQVSTGSYTSFETNDSVTSPQDPEPKTAGTDLSPVVESPASGKSPVSYPKIPGRLSRDYVRMVPPPPQPNFGAVFSSQSGMKPWKIAEINAQRERNRIQAEAQGSNQHRNQISGIKRRNSRDQPQSQSLAPNPFYPNSTVQPGPLTLNPSNSRSSSMVSQASNASSLLAKRRGEQKAQALKLVNDNDKGRQQAKWRVLKESDIQRAKSPGWRPQLAGGEGTMVERNELPSTPGWLPKLTPTRRGDELFLSVN